MRVRTITAIAAVVCFVAAAAAMPALAQEDSQEQVVGSPDLSFSTSAGGVDPGSSVEIPVSVVNRGNVIDGGLAQHEQRVKTARGLVVRVDSGSSPFRVNTGEMTAGDVRPGSKDVGSVQLSVPGDIEPGTYELDVEYEYEYTRTVTTDGANVEYSDLERTREGTLEVTVNEQANFLVENVSSSVLAGQTGQIEVDIRNAGSEPARDASVSAASLSQEVLFGSGTPTATSYVGKWEAGETRTVTFDASATPRASPGNYTMELSVTYQDTSGVDQARGPMTVGVPVGGEQNFVLNDLESNMQVGYEGRISATLVNEGPKPIKDPVAVLNVTDPRYVVTSPDQALPNLQPGERAQLNFSVDVSQEARPTEKQLALVLNWEAPSGDRLTSQPLTPSVNVAPRQDRFGVEALNSTVPVGQSRSVEVRVTNQGTETLSNVEAKAYLSDPLSGDDDEGYIPELPPGESSTFMIDVAVADGANLETRPVKFDFRYDRPNGASEISKQYREPIEVTQPESGGGWLPMVGLAVIAALIGGALIYKLRGGRHGTVPTPG